MVPVAVHIFYDIIIYIEIRKMVFRYHDAGAFVLFNNPDDFCVCFLQKCTHVVQTILQIGFCFVKTYNLFIHNLKFLLEEGNGFVNISINRKFFYLIRREIQVQKFPDENNFSYILNRIAAVIVIRIPLRMQDSKFLIIAVRIYTDSKKFRKFSN